MAPLKPIPVHRMRASVTHGAVQALLPRHWLPVDPDDPARRAGEQVRVGGMLFSSCRITRPFVSGFFSPVAKPLSPPHGPRRPTIRGARSAVE